VDRPLEHRLHQTLEPIALPIAEHNLQADLGHHLQQIAGQAVLRILEQAHLHLAGLVVLQIRGQTHLTK
jgi:hypothetical protein